MRTSVRLWNHPYRRPVGKSSIRYQSYHGRSPAFGQGRFLKVAEEVQDAVATGKPVVALETTIYTHGRLTKMFRVPRYLFGLIELSGFPYPENVALASRLESIVRANGGVPATIGLLSGVARVGMGAEELIELAAAAEKKTVLKVSRRDLGYICGLVILSVSQLSVPC
jgi:pseudouridine-5'-phosphate glycosidase